MVGKKNASSFVNLSRIYSGSAVPISASKTPSRILDGIHFPRREFLCVARGPADSRHEAISAAACETTGASTVRT